jgi:hypothetical protein
MIHASTNLSVFHASYQPIELVDLSLGKKRNDFGRGFYVTTSRGQAERFVRAAVRKAGIQVGHGYVSEYVISGFDGLDCLEFESTDASWLRCVAAFRTLSAAVAQWESRDVVIGKVANDDTMTVINVYLADGYGPVGSNDAVDMAIRLLKPERLQDQLCMKTDAAVARLRFVGATEAVI